MGCSSSSAQTVDQEKRPGTKPEEANGDTLVAQNGTIAEDAETIKDQVQLPVQDSSPEAPTPEDAQKEAEVEAASEAPELEPVEELMTSSEHKVSAFTEEPTPSATPAEPVEAETTSASREVEVASVEPFQAEEPPEVEAQESAADVPAVDTVVPLMTESSEVTQSVAAASTEASPGVEEVVDGAEAPVDEPAEPPEADQLLLSSVSSVPEVATEPLIDTQIAVATIPEMPAASPTPDQPQDQPQPSAEEVLETPEAVSKETDSAPEPKSTQGEELPASSVMVPVISTEVAPDPDAPEDQLKDSTASTSGVDSAPEPSPEVSPTQSSLDKVKKED